MCPAINEYTSTEWLFKTENGYSTDGIYKEDNGTIINESYLSTRHGNVYGLVTNNGGQCIKGTQSGTLIQNCDVSMDRTYMLRNGSLKLTNLTPSQQNETGCLGTSDNIFKPVNCESNGIKVIAFTQNSSPAYSYKKMGSFSKKTIRTADGRKLRILPDDKLIYFQKDHTEYDDSNLWDYDTENNLLKRHNTYWMRFKVSNGYVVFDDTKSLTEDSLWEVLQFHDGTFRLRDAQTRKKYIKVTDNDIYLNIGDINESTPLYIEDQVKYNFNNKKIKSKQFNSPLRIDDSLRTVYFDENDNNSDDVSVRWDYDHSQKLLKRTWSNNMLPRSDGEIVRFSDNLNKDAWGQYIRDKYSLWETEYVNKDEFRIKGVGSGMCLDVGYPNAKLSNCNNANLYYLVDPDSDKPIEYDFNKKMIASRDHGSLLRITDPDRKVFFEEGDNPNNNSVVWNYNNTTNQLTRYGSINMTLRSHGENEVKFFDSTIKDSYEKWQVIKLDNNNIRIKNIANGRCLMHGNSAGQPAILNSCNINSTILTLKDPTFLIL